MNFEQLAESRYSVRSFEERPVEQEKIDLILKAGRNAPTAANRQPQRILVINTADAMDKLKKCTKYTFGAPLAFLICCDTEMAWVRPYDEDNSGVVDATIATTQMMLQAHDLGLGTTWVGHFDPKMVVAAFGLPESFTPVAVLPTGYPAADSQPSPKHTTKLPEADVVYHDNFSS